MKKQKLRVLLSIRPKLLADVVRNMIENQPDMELVGEVPDPIQLLPVSGQTSVDVIIIVPLKEGGQPELCRRLLAEHPQIIIVTQPAEGNAAYLYQADEERKSIDEPCWQSIFDAVREALHPDVSLSS